MAKLVQKAYLNYGTESQVILWLVQNVDLDEASKSWVVTIKTIETGETEEYVPTVTETKPSAVAIAKAKKREEEEAKLKAKTVIKKVVSTVKKAVGGKKK